MDAQTHEPIGELTWLNNINILPAEEVQKVRVAIGADWPVFDSLRNAEEWAFWLCVDEKGQHWTRVGDAKVVKAALAGLENIAAGEHRVTRLNWWIEGIPHAAFPEIMSGWVGPIDEDAAPT
jgi:hypothetical protein